MSSDSSIWSRCTQGYIGDLEVWLGPIHWVNTQGFYTQQDTVIRVCHGPGKYYTIPELPIMDRFDGNGIVPLTIEEHLYLYRWGWGPGPTVGVLYHTFHYGRLEVYECMGVQKEPSYHTRGFRPRDGEYILQRLTKDQLLQRIAAHECTTR